MSKISESTKPDSEDNCSFTGVSQQRTRGSKFLFQELFRKKEESELKDINQETSESELVHISLQANKVNNYGGDKEGSPKSASAPPNIDRKSPKGLAMIKSRNGQVKIRPPISAADISFGVEKSESKNEKENVKRKKKSKEEKHIYKGKKRKSIDTATVIKESKDLKGKNKSKKFKLQTLVLQSQDSNSSNSSFETCDNIVNKTNDAYILEDDLSTTGSTTQEIFQNKEYKGNDSPKSNPSKNPGNNTYSPKLGNDDPSRLEIFTPSSSPETVEISSESDNESNKSNRKKNKVIIEETVIQPMILAEDSFQGTKVDDNSDSFDYVHKEVMTHLVNEAESPVIGIRKTNRKEKTIDEISGVLKKSKESLFIKKKDETCKSTELPGEYDQKKQIKKSGNADQTKKIPRVNCMEEEITSVICQNVDGAQNKIQKSLKDNDNWSQAKKTPTKCNEKETRSDVVITPECGSRSSSRDISPCSDAGFSPFMVSQPSQLMQTPRSRTIFTKLSLSQKRKPSNSQMTSNTEVDSTPQRILKSSMKLHLSKITSNTSILESIGSEHILSSDINNDINLIISEPVKHKTRISSDLESSYSIVDCSNSSVVDDKDEGTCENPQAVCVATTVNAKGDLHTTHISTTSYDRFDPEFTSTQHHNKIQGKGSYIQKEKKSESETVLQTPIIATKSDKSQEPEIITIKSSSEANSSEESATSYASSDSTEMLKPVGRSCLSGITM
ncbi:unnamed protein product, partial [Meganyctiphanes norvegica]